MAWSAARAGQIEGFSHLPHGHSGFRRNDREGKWHRGGWWREAT